VLRVVGGWVRDKLLGKESSDIDVALDCTTGKEFAERVNEYLASTGAATASVGVIHANPEQSKHLETATMCVHGLWLDFVNLRSESYADGSRIPDAVAFGTPREDALRRDLTVNALFYNLHSRAVEDWTGQGVADLRARLARTPLPPLRTLLDDPLRALRAVRLSTRLGFALDGELAAAAAAPEALAALGAKVSRERVGVEVEAMLAGPRPFSAMRLLVQLRMAAVVFALPPALAAAAPPAWPWASLLSLRRARLLLGAPRAAGAAPLWPQLDTETRRVALLAAWCAPLARCLEAPPPARPGAKPARPAPATAHVIRESLKLRARDAEQAARLLEAAAALRAVADEARAAAQPPSRARLGRVLRTARALWRPALCLAAAAAAPGAVQLAPTGQEERPGECAAAAELLPADAAEPDGEPLSPELEAVCAPFAALAERCDELRLDGCWDDKPLLTGGEVQAALGLERAGPALGVWLEALVDWQLEHPQASKQDAAAWLAQAKPRPVGAAA